MSISPFFFDLNPSLRISHKPKVRRGNAICPAPLTISQFYNSTDLISLFTSVKSAGKITSFPVLASEPILPRYF